MQVNEIGRITKITGAKVLIRVTVPTAVDHIGVESFLTSYISVGSLVGTRLVDGRLLVMTVEEIYDSDADIFVSSSISGIYDEVTEKFMFGTNTYPLVGEQVFKLWNKILEHIFAPSEKTASSTIGTYIYDSSVAVGYNPNVLFGKHLGVFGNTGSGKTCTVVSIIQNYIRNNQQKDIKFIILDVNGEYKRAFEESEADYIPFEDLRFHHSILSNPEYGRLFRAAEGVQYPALKDCIAALKAVDEKWDLEKLSDQIDVWIQDNTYNDKYGNKDNFSKNQISGYLRTMCLRIDGIVEDPDLMSVINSSDGTQTMDTILNTRKKVVILDLQVSSDSLDIVVYLLFKAIYEHKSHNRDTTHLSLVLEEAHRYINTDAEESRLGSYYIDKLSREGRKFGVGLIIASQIPSMLAYEVVSQCNSVIMHKITSKRDMEFLRGVLRVSNDTFYLQMSALEKQHAIVCGEAFPNDSIVKIHDARPLPRSNDPEINDIFPFEQGASGADGQEHFEDRDNSSAIELGEIGMPEETDE
ncbi:MAG: ATP-binding protein [Lachnospiraceae bacterium]|nr:ATP-binding protein [Lachnospiraceae bacterium]